MTGRVLVIVILVATILFGAGLWYSQVYAWYSDASDATRPGLVNLATGSRDEIPVRDLQAIDKATSPLGFRACFRVGQNLSTLSETYQPYPDPTPLIAPGWFDCFDAGAIDAGLETGAALAFLDTRNIRDGVDRVIAVFDDGRAYAWQQLNEKYADE